MNLKEIIGAISTSDTARIKRARIHQGWWRAFVLKQDPGKHPRDKAATICSTLPDQTAGTCNFITEEIGRLAESTALEHNNFKNSAGIMEINRLKTNLLSSQPLCFNFFGLLALDHELGLRTAQHFFPEITGFSGVRFEYAPSPRQIYTNDNSAFDVALEVSIEDERGLIGIECKYTEPFSPEEYRSPRYEEIYNSSSNFIASYDVLTQSKFNQLFRNQLIAESLLQAGDYQFTRTALFCSPEDVEAKNTGTAFGSMIKSGFKIIDFFEYITALQKMDLDPSQRKNTMMLWARYMAHELSQAASTEY
ncbi:PGN_0703 family putative restriction endonuclease [Caldimonas tepidiphila]|uniref:PGN_0703 family putative restriction endonuclease n=1 Tax=Caldimonas tepidiphila TaxID=2315841 RepID=UPI0013006BFA|nr:hypothetical protein [Caldimonas tepidiphila]